MRRQYNPNSAGSQHYSNAAGSLRTHGSGELSEAHLQILSAKTPWREGLADDCPFLLIPFVHRGRRHLDYLPRQSSTHWRRHRRLRSTPNAALSLHLPRRHRIHRRHLRRHIARRLARRPTLSIRFVHRCTSQAVDLLQNLLSDERPLVNRQPGRAPLRVSKLPTRTYRDRVSWQATPRTAPSPGQRST